MKIIRTEYSFKQCFGHLDKMVDMCEDDSLCIADNDNTYGHIQFSKACKKKGIKPVFGVRIRYTINPKQRTGQSYITILARNNEGLKELYGLVKAAYDNFFYFPRLMLDDISNVSSNVIIIQPDLGGIEIGDYKAITQSDTRRSKNLSHVFVQDNYYPETKDKQIYELLAGAQKRADGYVHNFENKTSPMHIVDQPGWTVDLSDECNAEIEMAEMVKFEGSKDIATLCRKGSERLKINIDDGEYADRLKRELDMIAEKGYEDYFLIVQDMLRYANKHMLVGPARGSSAGSLVCYLLDITKVDPIKYGLLFERFIDINRFDLPDTDIDFPDSKRQLVIDYLVRKYGEDNVKSLANINRLKARSAIDLFGMGLSVPKADCETVKNAMIERSAGDARNAMCISDTFYDTDPGKEFIKEHPKMMIVGEIENHAQHAGKHAAGIIVSNKPLINFGGVNSRDGVVMMDKRDAEDIGLLKIDCLALTTLSILEDAAKLAGMHRDAIYKLPFDDEKTFNIFNDDRLNGIFQFEGQALKMLTKSFHVEGFDDIVAITALARPGALRSGGAAKFAKRKTGAEEAVYYGDKHKSITSETMGIMVYQEQMMFLLRELAGFSWMDVSILRKAASKSMGDDFFGKYEMQFIEGCQSYSDMTEESAMLVWKDIQHAGSWIFNKSHAVSYGMLSYYAAYMKANHPIEFFAASLNHAKSEDSALRILRDGVENDGIEYTPIDPDESEEGWTVVDGKLLGGLTNIKGIASKKAKQIIKARKTGKFTPAILGMLMNPKTAFDILFPTRHLWGHIFDNPAKYGLLEKPVGIRDIDNPGNYVIIGRLIDRNLNDLNEHNKVAKRGHKLDRDTVYLNIILEDDHDSIMCSIGRFDYKRLEGKTIAEKANVGEDWFLVKGKMGSTWRGISVSEIINLTDWSKDNGS